MNTNSLNNLLANYSSNQQITAGENIFNYGQSADEVYLILQGLVVLFIKNETGQEKEIARLTSGDFLGALALLEDKTRSSRATAYKNTTLLALTPKHLKKLIYKQPKLNEKVITSLCNRIYQLEKPRIELPELTSQPQKEKKETKKEKKETDKINLEQQKKQEPTDKQQLKEVTNFYLEGHGNYSATAEESFDYYLYDKTISCPVCSTDIEVKKVRNSRLRLKDIRDDLRPFYKEFKPAWYRIWICPECFYTARRNDFFDFNSRTEKKIKQQFKDKVQNIFNSNYQPVYSKPRTLNEVFTAYYLAITLYDFIEARKDKLTSLWLRLSWLYEDADEEELSEAASLKAMKSLQEFYFEDDRPLNLSRAKKNKRTLLLALLFYKHGREEDALPLLDDLIRSPQTRRRYKQLARDKFMEIRENKKQEK